MKRHVSGLVRWVPIAVYAFACWLMMLGGETAGEFGVMVVLGAVLIVFEVAADWIAHGRPMIDQEQE